MRRQLAATALLTLALGSGAAPAGAAGPVRSGWWNTATVSGTALPSTTSPRDLHIALSPAGALAFAAVSYRSPAFASAVLTLHVVPSSQVGTPAVLACPTRKDDWASGGDQPSTAAPAYDCAGRSAVGVLGTDSAGASTLSFLLDPSQQLTPGVTSLGLVPASGTAFSLDLAEPDGASLSIQAPPAAPTPGAATPPPPPAGGGTVETAPPAVAAPAPGALAPGSVPVLPLLGQAPAAPQVAPTASPAQPLLAGPPEVLPVLARGRTASSSTDRRSAAALLALVILGFGYALVDSRPVPPRLLGGRARAGAGAVTSPPVGAARGIGRFARPRTEPARRLL
jgi:hypothetical protein